MKITKETIKQKVKTVKKWTHDHIGDIGLAAGVSTLIAGCCYLKHKTDGYLLIDPGKDDWKDHLTTIGSFRGKALTVRQDEAISVLNDNFYRKVCEENLVPNDVIIKINDDFCKANPQVTKVLDNIEGFWK